MIKIYQETLQNSRQKQYLRHFGNEATIAVTLYVALSVSVLGRNCVRNSRLTYFMKKVFLLRLHITGLHLYQKETFSDKFSDTGLF